jgi:hypothetical protein
MIAISGTEDRDICRNCNFHTSFQGTAYRDIKYLRSRYAVPIVLLLF